MAFTPEGMNPELAEQFAKIRRNFVAGLAKRHDEIENAPSDVERQAALHRLTGAAGAYGFDEISDLARAVMASPLESEKSSLDSLKRAILNVQKTI